MTVPLIEHCGLHPGEAMYRSLVGLAIKGDMRAAALLTRLVDRLGLGNPTDNDDTTIIVWVLPFGDGEP